MIIATIKIPLIGQFELLVIVFTNVNVILGFSEIGFVLHSSLFLVDCFHLRSPSFAYAMENRQATADKHCEWGIVISVRGLPDLRLTIL